MLKISITIPSYNQGKFLEETILSVLNQNYPNLEIFIIDGGSSDNSVDIIKKYSDRITQWVSEKDSGQSEAINKGFKMSSGEIVAWLCSDDLYTSGTLSKVNEIFSTSSPALGILHGNSEIFNEEQVVNYDKGYPDWSIERQLAGMTFPQPSSFIRRQFLEHAGYLNDLFHYGMDYELFSRLVMICEFKHADFFFSRYRLHHESKSTTSIARFIDEWIIIFNSIVDGLDFTETKKKLSDAGLDTSGNERIVGFFSSLTEIKKINHEKMLFYFLVNVLRYDYVSGRFHRTKAIGNILKNDFEDYIKFEPSILKIIRRVNIMPHGLLQMAREIKRTLSKE